MGGFLNAVIIHPFYGHFCATYGLFHVIRIIVIGALHKMNGYEYIYPNMGCINGYRITLYHNLYRLFAFVTGSLFQAHFPFFFLCFCDTIDSFSH